MGQRSGCDVLFECRTEDTACGGARTHFGAKITEHGLDPLTFGLLANKLPASLASAEVDFWRSQLPQRVEKSSVGLPITTASREVDCWRSQLPERVEKSTFAGPNYHSESRSRRLAAPITPASREVDCWRTQLQQRVEKSIFGGPNCHSESRSRLVAVPITTASREC